VRVLVTGTALDTGEGVGHIDGQPLPISIATVERVICNSGTFPVIFDLNGQAMDLGREQRLYSKAQRIALGTQWGGCAVPGCNCPAAMTEAHHLHGWKGGGKTDLADGILLCRFHHMLLHNNHWRIERDGYTYWLIPPKDVDPERTPRQLHSKSPALRDLLSTRDTG
jgi:hypothetical protein